MKKYYTQDNIGSVKYTVSFHNGTDTHNDGSPFYDIRCFKNKAKRNRFVKELQEQGYTNQ